jgi:hypothetical protein
MAQRNRLSRADLSLLSRCRRLDGTALQAVLYRHADDVYERLVARLRDRDAAEEAFAEVFARFVTDAPGFNGSRTVLEHLLDITDAVAPPTGCPALASDLREADFVDLVPRAALVMQVEKAILRDAPGVARTALRASRLARRQLIVAGAGLAVAVVAVLASRLAGGRYDGRQGWQPQFVAQAIAEGELVEEVGEWIRREEQSPFHGDARRRDMEELRLVLEQLAMPKRPGRAMELRFIVERLRRGDLIALAYELADEADTSAERRRMLWIAELLEEVSVQ